jgi:hypothetical protein
MNPFPVAWCAGAVMALAVSDLGPLHGQVGVAIELQRSAYGGGSEDTTTGSPGGSFRPAHAQAVALRIDRRVGKTTVALGVRYIRSAGAVDVPGVHLALAGEFTAFEATPELRFRIARSNRGASLSFYGGPVVGVWLFEDFGGRAVPGATAGITGEFPVFDRLVFSVRIGASLLHSVFREGELPPELALRTMRRSEISLGFRYGR